MIWKNPLYKDRPLSEWLRDVQMPPGIEQLVEKVKPKESTRRELIKGALLLVSKARKDEAVATVIAVLKDHADDLLCFSSFQVLRGLARLPRRNEPDSFVTDLESTDLLIVTSVSEMSKEDLATLDRALESRGFRPPRVTVLIGETPVDKTNHFEALRDAYEGRVYELRGEAPAKGA